MYHFTGQARKVKEYEITSLAIYFCDICYIINLHKRPKSKHIWPSYATKSILNVLEIDKFHRTFDHKSLWKYNNKLFPRQKLAF